MKKTLKEIAELGAIKMYGKRKISKLFFKKHNNLTREAIEANTFNFGHNCAIEDMEDSNIDLTKLFQGVVDVDMLAKLISEVKLNGYGIEDNGYGKKSLRGSCTNDIADGIIEHIGECLK